MKATNKPPSRAEAVDAQEVVTWMFYRRAMLRGGTALEHDLPQPPCGTCSRACFKQQSDFPVLMRSHGTGTLTVLHVIDASDLADYERRAHEWAQAVWESWTSEHERLRLALDAASARPSARRNGESSLLATLVGGFVTTGARAIRDVGVFRRRRPDARVVRKPDGSGARRSGQRVSCLCVRARSARWSRSG